MNTLNKEIFYLSASSEVIEASTFYLHVLTVDTTRMFPYSVERGFLSSSK